jgi:hypothetical protein
MCPFYYPDLEINFPHNHRKKQELVCAFLRVYGYGTPMFKKFMELYTQRKSYASIHFFPLPGFIDWFCGTFLSELFFMLKDTPDQAEETLSQLICEPDKYGSPLFTKYSENISDRAWEHQHPEFTYANISGIDADGTIFYD